MSGRQGGELLLPLLFVSVIATQTAHVPYAAAPNAGPISQHAHIPVVENAELELVSTMTRFHPRRGLSGAAASDAIHRENTVRDLRCYCNLPACATRGYMCRTSRGQCFFELHAGQVTLQGCSDLDSVAANVCHNVNVARAPAQTLGGRDGNMPAVPARLCCQQHLCNHPAYVGRLERRLAALRRNGSRAFKQPPSRQQESWPDAGATASALSAQELWFRAAVIAVLVAGGCIMVVLVAVAVRLLRPDSWHLAKQGAPPPPPTEQLLLPAPYPAVPSAAPPVWTLRPPPSFV